MLGPRLQSSLATWAARNTGDTFALWAGEDATGQPSYISLTPGPANVVSDVTFPAQLVATAVRATFAPTLGADLVYELMIGHTPLWVRVQAADNAAAAQARVPEAWAAGLWALDGWTLADLGAGVWQVTAPPALGAVPTCTPGYGWSITGQTLAAGRRDVTLLTTLLSVRLVFWAPARSRLLALANAHKLMALVRGQTDASDRGAELGLQWGTRPALAEPEMSLAAQGDLGGIVDAATLDLAIYAHTVTMAETAVLAGATVTAATVPAIPLAVIEVP